MHFSREPSGFGVRCRSDDHHLAAGAVLRQELQCQWRGAPFPG
jgi:hypothetical protein